MAVFFLILLLTGTFYGAGRLGVGAARNLRDSARVGTALAFILVGATHFLTPDKYMELMPPFVPAPALMIYLSGFFEILGGVGLLVAATRKAAAFGLAALLLAVFPANVYVALNNVQLGGFMNYSFYQWLRLPMQFALIGWVLWTVEIIGPRNTRTERKNKQR